MKNQLYENNFLSLLNDNNFYESNKYVIQKSYQKLCKIAINGKYTHNFKTNWDTLNGYNSIMSRAILMKFFSK